MHEVLERHIIARIGEGVPKLDEVLSHFKPLKLKRNHTLLRAGEVCKWCYFVVEGSVQVFAYDAEGNVSTRDFVLEDNWVTEIASFSNQTPASEFLKTVEPAQLLAINVEGFKRLSAEVPSFELIYKQILEQSYMKTVYRLNTFVGMDSLQRLRWIHAHQPHLLTRFSNKLIASYLGVSAETLSRLKARL